MYYDIYDNGDSPLPIRSNEFFFNRWEMAYKMLKAVQLMRAGFWFTGDDQIEPYDAKKKST